MPRQGQRAVAIFFSLAVVLASTGGCDKIKSKQAVKAGNEFFKAGKYETALASLPGGRAARSRARSS